MTPQHRFLLAVVIVASLAGTTPAQNPNSQIVSQGQVTTLQVQPDANPSAGSFPSLALHAEDPSGDPNAASPAGELTGPAVTVAFSLIVVLGLFAALVWVTRRFGARSMGGGALPSEVVQSLGSASLDPRTRITLVRCGRRILVLSQTQSEIRPLSEIADSDEVRELTAACLGDSKQAFDAALKSIEREKAPSGYLGPTAEQSPQPATRQPGRLFATA